MIPWLLIAAISLGVAYEAVALKWRIWPTITDLLSANEVTAFVALVGIVLAAWWAAAHVVESVK